MLKPIYKKLACFTHPDKFTRKQLQKKIEEIETKTPLDTRIKNKLLSNNKIQGNLFKFMSSKIDNTKKELLRPPELLHHHTTRSSVQHPNQSNTRTPGVHPNQQQPAA